jgi:hypothetical protein
MSDLSALARCFALFLTALVLLPGAAAAQGTVEGMLRLDDRAIPITHVYARETRPSPTDDQGPSIVILMTDRPAPAELVASRQAFYRAATAGTIAGVQLILEPRQDRTRVIVFAPGGARDDMMLPDVFDRLALRDLARAGGSVSAHLISAEPLNLLDGAAESPQTYAVDLRFRTQVTPAPQPTRELTGDAARNSAPVAAATRALQVIHTGTLAEIRAQLSIDDPTGAQLAGPRGEEMLRIARQMLPTPAAYVPSVQRVIFYGEDEAIVVSREREGNSTVSLRRQNGVWKQMLTPIPND